RAAEEQDSGDSITEKSPSTPFLPRILAKSKTSSTSISSPSKMIPNVSGLLTFAVKSPTGRYMIQGTNNRFGSIQVETCVIDSGCNSILLPLTDGVQKIFQEFGDKKYQWSIEESSNTGPFKPLVLHIKTIRTSIPV
ncbi:unnamed protein product, partial [Didymodactylos carnosus]